MTEYDDLALFNLAIHYELTTNVCILIKNPANDLKALEKIMEPGLFENVKNRVLNLEKEPFYLMHSIDTYHQLDGCL